MSARAALDADEDEHDEGDDDERGMVKMQIDDDEDHGLTTPNARIDKTV